jgi:predicted small metal-binding protein
MGRFKVPVKAEHKMNSLFSDTVDKIKRKAMSEMNK